LENLFAPGEAFQQNTKTPFSEVIILLAEAVPTILSSYNIQKQNRLYQQTRAHGGCVNIVWEVEVTSLWCHSSTPPYTHTNTQKKTNKQPCTTNVLTGPDKSIGYLELIELRKEHSACHVISPFKHVDNLPKNKDEKKT
jgi:hypothetical protein